MKSAIQRFLSRSFSFLRTSLTSWVALLFAAIHIAWFFLAVTNMRPPSRDLAKFLETVSGSTTALFAGRPFHFHYESLGLKLLIIGDMPAMLASLPIGFLLWPVSVLLHLDRYAQSYISAGILLLLGTCQWTLIGRIVQLRMTATRPPL